MKFYNVRYAYHRPDLFLSVDKETASSMGVDMRPLTVAYQKVAASETDDTVVAVNCAISICNAKDNFEKSKGRLHSTKRLVEKDPVWSFQITNDRMVVLISGSELDPFEAINENFAPMLLNFMKHSAISRFVVGEALKHVAEKGL